MIAEKITINHFAVFWDVTLLDELGGICGAYPVVHPGIWLY